MKTKTNNYKMDNCITYDEYCRISEEFKKLLTELEFNKESGHVRKCLLDDYVDFMLKYPDYYTRQAKQHQEQADEDISYVVNDAIEKLNDRIQSGDCSAERCYAWLTKEKNYYDYLDLVNDCQVLNPEQINVDNTIKNLKEVTMNNNWFNNDESETEIQNNNRNRK